MRYLSSTEVVSASTDSTLRLWNTRTLSQTRRFSGHVNEKNFVGLSVDSEFIACGSETDEVLGDHPMPKVANQGYFACALNCKLNPKTPYYREVLHSACFQLLVHLHYASCDGI